MYKGGQPSRILDRGEWDNLVRYGRQFLINKLKIGHTTYRRYAKLWGGAWRNCRRCGFRPPEEFKNSDCQRCMACADAPRRSLDCDDHDYIGAHVSSFRLAHNSGPLQSRWVQGYTESTKNLDQ